MTKENDERFDRAVAALDSVVAQTTSMSPGYEDGLVAGMMDFLHGWFADESYRAIKRAATGSYEHDFSRGYRVFMPSPLDHNLRRKAPINYIWLSEGLEP
jgi:hypothetical protein